MKKLSKSISSMLQTVKNSTRNIFKRISKLSVASVFDLILGSATAGWMAFIVIANIIAFPMSLGTWLLVNIPLSIVLISTLALALKPTAEVFSDWSVWTIGSIASTIMTSVLFASSGIFMFVTIPMIVLAISAASIARESNVTTNFEVVYTQPEAV